MITCLKTICLPLSHNTCVWITVVHTEKAASGNVSIHNFYSGAIRAVPGGASNAALRVDSYHRLSLVVKCLQWPSSCPQLNSFSWWPTRQWYRGTLSGRHCPTSTVAQISYCARPVWNNQPEDTQRGQLKTVFNWFVAKPPAADFIQTLLLWCPQTFACRDKGAAITGPTRRIFLVKSCLWITYRTRPQHMEQTAIMPPTLPLKKRHWQNQPLPRVHQVGRQQSESFQSCPTDYICQEASCCHIGSVNQRIVSNRPRAHRQRVSLWKRCSKQCFVRGVRWCSGMETRLDAPDCVRQPEHVASFHLLFTPGQLRILDLLRDFWTGSTATTRDIW